MNELWSKPPALVDAGGARIAYRSAGQGALARELGT